MTGHGSESGWNGLQVTGLLQHPRPGHPAVAEDQTVVVGSDPQVAETVGLQAAGFRAFVAAEGDQLVEDGPRGHGINAGDVQGEYAGWPRGDQQPPLAVLDEVIDRLVRQIAGEGAPGGRVQGKAAGRADPEALVAVDEQGTDFVGRDRLRIGRIIPQVDAGVVVQGEDAEAGGIVAEEKPVRGLQESVERSVQIPGEIPGVVTGERPGRRIQPVDAGGEGAYPHGTVLPLFEVGDIIVGEEFRTLTGPIIYKGARLLVIAGQAAFLQGDPDRGGRTVGKYVIDQVARQSVGLLEEGAGPDAVETVQALLRSHPDQAVRVHGDIVDETVGQTDLLGRGHKRKKKQEGK